MASRRITIYDLTEDSSSDENTKTVATVKSTMTREPARPPLGVVQNDARPTAAAQGGISAALKSVFKTLSESRLRAELEIICSQHDAVHRELEKKFLVMGKEVVRYHADSESEGEGETGESGSSRPQQRNVRRPIAVSEDEWTPRYAKCENCKEEFDVTQNSERNCQWHSNVKAVDYGSDFWADHDENCHGACESFEDDEDFQEGFIWQCCENQGDDPGCMVTRHKAKANIPTGPQVIQTMQVEEEVEKTGEREVVQKEIAIPDIKWIPSVQAQKIQCGRCPEEYDPMENDRMKCQWHPGPKEINFDSEAWYDHDGDFHGPDEMDASKYAKGFTWECCGGQVDDSGCEQGNHVPEVPALSSKNKRKAEEEISRPATYPRIF